METQKSVLEDPLIVRVDELTIKELDRHLLKLWDLKTKYGKALSAIEVLFGNVCEETSFLNILDINKIQIGELLHIIGEVPIPHDKNIQTLEELQDFLKRKKPVLDQQISRIGSELYDRLRCKCINFSNWIEVELDKDPSDATLERICRNFQREFDL